MEVRTRIKDPGLAAVLSFFFSGLGQIYNGEIVKGLLFMLAQVLNVILLFFLIGFLSGFAIWVYGIVDAYTSAELINARGAR